MTAIETSASAARYTIASSLSGLVATRTLRSTPALHIDKSNITSRYTSVSVAGRWPWQNSRTSGIEVDIMQHAPTTAMPVGHPPFSSTAIVGKSPTLRHHAIATKRVLAFITCGAIRARI